MIWYSVIWWPGTDILNNPVAFKFSTEQWMWQVPPECWYPATKLQDDNLSTLHENLRPLALECVMFTPSSTSMSWTWNSKITQEEGKCRTCVHSACRACSCVTWDSCLTLSGSFPTPAYSVIQRYFIHFTWTYNLVLVSSTIKMKVAMFIPCSQFISVQEWMEKLTTNMKILLL